MVARKRRGLKRFVARRIIPVGVAAVVLWIGMLVIRSLNRQSHHRISKPVVNVSVKFSAPEPPGPPGIVLHNSDTPGRINGRWVDEKMLDRIHRDDHPRWADVCDGRTYHIGYHYVILANGVVQPGRPDDCLGAHARTHNDWLGICLVGGFSTNRHWWPQQPTRRQMRSLVLLCEQLMSKYHIPPYYVKRHRDINMTWCPGDRFPYRALMAELRHYSAAHSETHPLFNRVVSLAIPRPHERRIYTR